MMPSISKVGDSYECDPDPGKPAGSLQGWHKLHAAGKSVREWAKERGVSAELVYAVLRGERKCFRGKSHRVAVELGLKIEILE